MTIAALASPGKQFGLGAGTVSAGVSDAAEHLAAQLKHVFLDSIRTAIGQTVILPTNRALRDSYEEAQRLAQQGEQMLPTSAAMREAHELLIALPHWCIAPVPTIEPSGAIALEWDLGPGRWLVFAVKGTGALEHSAMIGLGNEQWGTRNFAGALGQYELVLLSELMHMKD